MILLRPFFHHYSTQYPILKWKTIGCTRLLWVHIDPMYEWCRKKALRFHFFNKNRKWKVYAAFTSYCDSLLKDDVPHRCSASFCLFLAIFFFCLQFLPNCVLCGFIAFFCNTYIFKGFVSLALTPLSCICFPAYYLTKPILLFALCTQFHLLKLNTTRKSLGF